MDTSVGRSERTVVFDGEKRGKEGTDPAHIYLDFITVNGVCQSTKDPWSLKVASGSPFWPGAKLLKEFPHSRLIAVNIQLGRLSSWHSIINSGENLLYEIKSHVVKKNPHVFLCHGIGGLVAFQAVSLLKSEIWQRLLPLQVAGIVTFGTPIAGVDDTATFCSTLEACAAVESGLEVPSKFDDILQTPVQIEALRQAIVENEC